MCIVGLATGTTRRNPGGPADRQVGSLLALSVYLRAGETETGLQPDPEDKSRTEFLLPACVSYISAY